MAAYTLALSDGSKHLLGSLFPNVPHVGRFNLTPGAARAVLFGADRHLGTMAVPYALSIHEDLLRSCIELAGGTPPHSAAHLHTELEMLTGGAFGADELAQFHLLREMRNAIVHCGGLVNQRVVDRITALSRQAEQHWRGIVGRSPNGLAVGARVEFGTGELFLAEAATRVLAYQANRMLIPALSVQRWAEVIVDDFLVNGPANIKVARRRRAMLLGFARHHYLAAQVPDKEILVRAIGQGLPV